MRQDLGQDSVVRLVTAAAVLHYTPIRCQRPTSNPTLRPANHIHYVQAWSRGAAHVGLCEVLLSSLLPILCLVSSLTVVSASPLREHRVLLFAPISLLILICLATRSGPSSLMEHLLQAPSCRNVCQRNFLAILASVTTNISFSLRLSIVLPSERIHEHRYVIFREIIDHKLWPTVEQHVQVT